VVLALCIAIAAGGDLEDLAHRYQFNWTQDAATGRHTIKSDRLSLAFVPGISTVVINGVPETLAMAPALESGHVKLPPYLVLQIESNCPMTGLAVKDGPRPPLPAPNPPAMTPKAVPKCPPFVIAIDAGHGGIHTGYKGRREVEKDINLDVALEVERILASWGVKVVMTRRDDREFSRDIDDDLMSRVRIVNAARPDLFISIHTNGVDHPGPRGFEVWVPLPQDTRGAASRDLASLIRSRLGIVWGRSSEDRGTKDEHNLRVLKQTSCPAALVEMEFVSNPQAERLLASREHKTKIATAIAEAAREWIQKRR
jgi:N-acetylmuramoyl-L-alanine amidase